MTAYQPESGKRKYYEKNDISYAIEKEKQSMDYRREA